MKYRGRKVDYNLQIVSPQYPGLAQDVPSEVFLSIQLTAELTREYTLGRGSGGSRGKPEEERERGPEL